MQVTLLGTGDTTGTPTPRCDCETCAAARERGVERTRFSVHVRNEATDESLLVDLSPDFRHQFLTQDVALPDAAVVTHVHFDHLHGLGNAHRLLDSLAVHAVDEVDPATGESVADSVRSQYDYLRPLTVHDHAPFETFSTCGFDVTLVPVDHPPMLCYGVVVERDGTKLALTGDTSYAIPDDSRNALADADLLLADAIVPASLADSHPVGGDHRDDDGVARTFGTKHMTREGALALAEELGAAETRLVHVSHFYPADEAFEEPLAVDGERFSL
ncbi:MBL fold metallo-hydrolase [Halomicrococcus sp. NG-SE-24]|uniref:MBL fold metallo-hydrolase n=1 Tax=Halomicrococcus sp. NG-SE-24 TaxID=3436928 RepID=UPI003D959017